MESAWKLLVAALATIGLMTTLVAIWGAWRGLRFLWQLNQQDHR